MAIIISIGVFMYYVIIIFLSLTLSGCVTSPVYNPMQVNMQQEILLNESGFKAIREGMTMDQVHGVMGDKLVIGYALESPQSSGYKPLTIPNPYKNEAVKGTNYLIEYYIEAIRQPDGIVSDNELMPLIYKDGKLIGRGWPLANTLRSPHSQA